MSLAASELDSGQVPTVVLGSRSPRRRELLELLVPAERIVVRPPSSAEEPGFDDLSDRDAILDRLRGIARAKCEDVSAQCAATNIEPRPSGSGRSRPQVPEMPLPHGRGSMPTARRIIVAADTVIVAEDARGRRVVLGQPPEEDGGETIRRWFGEYLFGRTHEAITALCVARIDENAPTVETRHSPLVTRHSRSAERTVATRVTFRERDDDLLEWYLGTGEPFGKAGAYGIQGAGSLFATRIEGSLSNVIGLPLETLREILTSLTTMIHVTRAEYLCDHRLHLWFDDGTDGEVDLSDALDGDIFAPLREVAYFRRFHLEGHTVAWPNGADFAPEYLHRLAHSPAPT